MTGRSRTLYPPVPPQLARSRSELPRNEGIVYEPKMDGFRAICFVCGEDMEIQSRGGKPLRRYFPEVTLPAGDYVADGELLIRGENGRDDFELLGNRIHPAESRIAMLAETTPARFVAFDLLADGDESLLDRPFRERRERLESYGERGLELSELTTDPERAELWLTQSEGVIAKEPDAIYRPGERVGMFKIKRMRSMDCVVMGYRPGKAEGTIGSLILGVFDAGRLRPVGHASGFSAAEKRRLRGELAALETGERGSGDPSRWSSGRDLEWVELRPERVVEVNYNHASNGRIRHGAKVVRFRDDRDPESCLVDQLDMGS